MSKHDGLRDHLRQQAGPEFSLMFKEIETAIGGSLPKSADRPQWWANVTDPQTSHVQRNAWREAGYDAFLVAGSERVTFRKTGRFS
jgi:hypothetical protein